MVLVAVLLPVMPLLVPVAIVAQTPGTPTAASDCIPEMEPNDQPPDAMRLPATTACVAGDNTGPDQDVVRWTLDEAGAALAWDISATGIPGQAVSVNVYPIDPAAAEGTVPELLLKAGGGAGREASLTGLYWPAGDYLIGVATSGAGTYRLTIAPSAVTPNPGDVEPNDDAATATELTGAFALSGDRAGSADWYAWELDEVDAASHWDLTFRAGVGTGAFLQVSTEDQVPILYRAVAPDGILSVPDLGLAAGRYLLYLVTSDGTTLPYSLSATPGTTRSPELEDEPNDTAGTAMSLALGPDGATVGGRLGTAGEGGDTDRYRFTLDETRAGRKMDLKALWRSGPPRQLCLSDSADQTLRCAPGDDGVAFNDLVLPVGDYGVSLSGDPDPSAPYLLRVDITAPEVAGYEAEPNETIGLASPLDVSGEFPTIRGRLDGPDQDMFRFTVTGEPQLWDISASGPGLARLDVVNVTGTAETTRAAVDGEVTIYDAFFLPGNHWVQIGGTGGEYVVTAAPRGPPDPAAEHEPNDGPDRSQPIRLGEKRTGRLIDPADVDIYRFSLQNDGHVLIDVAVPPDGLFTARLEANGMEVARVTAALPGDPITYDAFLSPGDYTLWLSPTTPSTGRYRLSVTPLDPLTVPDDAEPNDAPADARPMPADLSVSGTLDPRLANGADVDTYRITPLPAETTATIQVTGDAEVTMWVPATPGVPETALTLTPATGDGRFDVTLPGASDILVRLSGQGAYRLVLLTGDAVAAATPGPTTGDRRGPGSGLPESGLPGRSRGPGDGTSVELDTPAGLAVDLLLTVVADGSVAAYWPQGQRLDATLTITNTGDASIDLDLDATTGHYAWVVALDAAAVTLGPGESRTVPVVVRVAPDAWADEPVLVTVRAREDDLQRTASVTVIPGRDAAPLNSEPYEPLPPSLLGGLNVARAGLGGVPVAADATSATTEAEIYDGFSPAAGGWSADAAALPAELTIDLAGDDPVPVAGIALLSLGGFEVTERLRGFDLELSLDGQTFTPALSAEVSANPVEQVFALDTPVHARFARLRVTSGQVATASRVRIAQWKVIAEPGWSPPGEDGGLELAAPGRGGHLVTMAPLPPGSIALPPLPADGTTHLSIPTEPGQTISWVVGFRDDRAAQITTITWSDPAGSDPAVRFDEVTVEVSAESPTGPWTPAGTWRLDRSGPDAPRLDLSRPIWARFVRFTGIAGDGGVPDATTVVWELPGPIGVIERAQDDDYRSILGEWGHYRTEAIYERLVPPPVLTLDPDAGDGAEGATALPLDHRVTDSAWVGQDEDWYRVDVPAGETFLAFTLGGDPSLDVNVALFDGAGSRVSLGQEVSSARETIFTAAVEPGASYDLRVTEPPSSIVIAFDTSSSLGPYAATFYPALNRYAGDVQTGQEAVNVLPFGTDPLLDTPSDQPYLLQAAVTNYPRTESSSDSEGTLLTAMDDMADQPGTRAIVLLTDAASSPAPEDLALLWPTLGANTPRVFAVHVSGGGPTAATEQHLMQDWAAVNHGIYAYAVSQGEIDVAFDRAVTLLRRPSVYTLVAEPADPPATPEPEPAATAEPSAAPEPEPTATIPAEPGTLRVVAATVVAGQSAVAAGDASVAIIVDTSGSMLAPLDGTSRADVAKVALVDLVTTTLPPGTDVSLRAFGVVPDSCETRLVVPRAPLDPAAMVDTIQGLEIVNLVRTPLGASLEAVAGDLGTEPGPKIVVFVTDGEETCGGDPAAAIQALIDSGIDVRVNIVGFALDDDALKTQFEEWARLGNGRYIDAADGAELAAAVAEAVQPTYDVLDASGTVVARGQVGGDAVSLPPGTYSVVVGSELTQTIDGVIVTSGDETTVTSTGDQTGIGAGPAVDYREVAASRTPP